MPIYDYICSACGVVTEVIHGIHDGGPRFCPACGTEGSLRKGFTTPAVHFKGSGWAKKDRSATSSPGATRHPKPAADSASGTTSPSADASGGASSAAPKTAGSDGGD